MNNIQKEIINKIKTRGYWKIVIEPVFEVNNFFNHIIDAKKMVEQNRVQLRGWDYPHYPTKTDDHEGVCLETEQLDGYIDWDYFKESWTYFKSGQFIHLLGLREDWFDEANYFGISEQYKNIKPKSMLDFVGTTFTVTEIFIFALNLIANSNYKNRIKITISLNNTNGRAVQTLDHRRSIWAEYKATADNIKFHEEEYSSEDLSLNYLKCSRDAAINLFKYFQWEDPSEAVIEQDQKNFLERKI